MNSEAIDLSASSREANPGKTTISILWFRHGLRLHDNPALLEAVKDKSHLFLPIFIFDGESAGTKIVGYNRMRFLLESLEDLNVSFKQFGGGLRLFQGKPVAIFESLLSSYKIAKICFEQDCEPIWKPRDDAVRQFCRENGIEVIETVSHTLYDPAEILEANGGSPPLTYASLMFVVSCLGKPPRPSPSLEPGKDNINFLSKIPNESNEINFPVTPQQFGIRKEKAIGTNPRKGGEKVALILLQKRLDIEKSAFEKGFMLPNHSNPDLFLGASLSPCLRFGCVSVRQFYWSVQDLFASIVGGKLSCETITGQLFWRDYFYIMSVPNPNFDRMKSNPICLHIPWSNDANAKDKLKKWKEGKTGYPFIDAGMRQLVEEGWLHHVTRNAVACFLTRSDLWISWEKGLKHFLKYLLDADWSVCAGNWLWVSSSAFENVLDCTHCVCPTNYALRLDPNGKYIKRFIPELAQFPVPYIFEPWKAPVQLQQKWGCVIGKDYPAPIVDHAIVSKINKQEMLSLRNQLAEMPAHACPSDTMEARHFMGIPENCAH